MATMLRSAPRATCTHCAFTDIRFSKDGWKQFCGVNRVLGFRYIRAFILKRELDVYLSAHEAAGVSMDTDCQEVRYDDNICLILRKEQGVWYITDVIIAEAPDTFLPVYSVRNVLRGLMSVIVLVFTGWRSRTGATGKRAVIV